MAPAIPAIAASGKSNPKMRIQFRVAPGGGPLPLDSDTAHRDLLAIRSCNI
jgi:hypothetical protein